MFNTPIQSRFLETVSRLVDLEPGQENDLQTQLQEFLQDVRSFTTGEDFITVDDTLDSLIYDLETLAGSQKKALVSAC